MITLEYFGETDFDQLIGWINNEELLLHWAGTHFKFPLNQRKLASYIEDANDFNKSTTFVFKAVDTATGKTVGHISLTSINRRNRSARITRVFVADSERGKGIAAQMVKALMETGFEQLQLHRMSLGVYDNNQPAITCYKKCGFRTDGVLRDIQRHNDSYWSLIEMSILEDEWREGVRGLRSDTGFPTL